MYEAYKSREGGSGESTSYDLVYFVFNADRSFLDELDATDYVLNNKPDGYNGYNYLTYSIKQLVLGMYEFTLKYGAPGSATQLDIGTLSFSVGGGTQHITNSISKVDYRDSTLLPSAMDFQGAIGVEVNSDGTNARVRGVEIYAPILEYSVSTQLLFEDVTTAYIDAVYNLCGKVNIQDFYGRPAKSVLFKGAHGQKKSSDRWELSFDFAYSPNMTNIAVGAITVAAKSGWDYLDIFYIPQPRINNLKMMLPGQATVHQVYYSGDFSALGLGTYQGV